MNLWVRKPQAWEYCKNISKETRRCQNIHSVHVECVIHGAFCHDSPNGISFRREWKIRGNVESKKQMTEMILEYWNVSQLRKQKEIQNLTVTRAFVYSRRKTTYMAYNWLTGRLTEQGVPGSLHHRSGLAKLQPKEALTMEGSPTRVVRICKRDTCSVVKHS